MVDYPEAMGVDEGQGPVVRLVAGQTEQVRGLDLPEHHSWTVVR